MNNTYIQDKLDIIDIFDYIVFEDGDIDKEKSNKKLKQSLTEAYNKGQTDYHNHIVEKFKEKYKFSSSTTLFEILSLLQDTNKE